MRDADYLLDVAQRNLPKIREIYKTFEDKKPVMFFDIQEQRIFAYPFIDFRDEMSKTSQNSLEDQYEAAVRENKMVVFVRDNEQRRLVSFSMDVE